jgi:broad specificity phosphatase PhoE
MTVDSPINSSVDEDNDSSILKMFLVRHAESEENIRVNEIHERLRFKKKRNRIKKMSLWKALGVFDHKYRNCNITPNGRAVAHRISQYLGENPLDPNIDLFWHSPLKRTHQTMNIIFPGKQIIEKRFLREKRPGEYLIPFGFNRRVKKFKDNLCQLDPSIKCIVVGGHGMFFKHFLGKHYPNELKNVEIVVCEFDRRNGILLSAKNILNPTNFHD